MIPYSRFLVRFDSLVQRWLVVDTYIGVTVASFPNRESAVAHLLSLGAAHLAPTGREETR